LGKASKWGVKRKKRGERGGPALCREVMKACKYSQPDKKKGPAKGFKEIKSHGVLRGVGGRFRKHEAHGRGGDKQEEKKLWVPKTKEGV